MEILFVGIGFMMLIAGRPVYSVFVGSISFLVGTYLTSQIKVFPPEWNSFFIPLLFAIIGVVLTQVFKRWTARVAGFIAGGIMIINLPNVFGSASYWTSPYLFAAAGIISVILLFFIYDFALIVLSSLMAVTLILSYIRVGNLDQGAMFLILAIFGIITQYLILQYASPSPD
jgi:uncharacterized membrane protein